MSRAAKRETATDFVELVIWDISFETFYVWNGRLIDRIGCIVEGKPSQLDRLIFQEALDEAKDHVRRTTNAEDVDEEIDLVVWAAKVLREHNKEKLRRARFNITYEQHILTNKAKKLLCKKCADPEFLAEYWKLMPEDSAGITHDGRYKMRQEALMDLLEKLVDSGEAAKADDAKAKKGGKGK